MRNRPFVLGATIESAEQSRQVYGSDDWVQVEAQGPTIGIRVEFRVQGAVLAVRIVGFEVGHPSADREIYQETLPLPPEEMAG